MQEAADFNRRTPIQSRAQSTTADLFEAAAQLLEVGAPERLTTNSIAARAGYSIGTLYRYFPNKLALLRAMASREIHAQESKVQAALQGLASTALTEPVVRIFVRAVLHPFAGRHRVHAGMMQLLTTAPVQSTISHSPTNAQSGCVNEAFFSAPPAVLMDISNETKFTMIHAVSGAIAAALRSKPELIESPEFENQLVGLVLHFLDADNQGHRIRLKSKIL
jgi:AcrR family transcriptional regulator